MTNRLPEQTIKTEHIYDGRIINVRVETVELPDMKYAKREIVDHANAVGMIAISDRGTMYMVRQYRIAVREFVLEIPAGLIEHDENPQETAIRELQEEIGYKPNKLEYLLDSYASPGFTNEKLSLFLATDLEESKLDLDDSEFLEVEEYPIDELYQMVLNFEITDSKSIIGIMYAYFNIYLKSEKNK